jgi:hypothetical protein
MSSSAFGTRRWCPRWLGNLWPRKQYGVSRRSGIDVGIKHDGPKQYDITEYTAASVMSCNAVRAAEAVATPPGMAELWWPVHSLLVKRFGGKFSMPEKKLEHINALLMQIEDVWRSESMKGGAK